MQSIKQFKNCSDVLCGSLSPKTQLFIKEIIFQKSLESYNNDADMSRWGRKIEAGIKAPNCVLKASICLNLEIFLAGIYNQQSFVLKTEL